QCGKACRVGSRYPERIADARGLWPEYGLGKYRIECRFESLCSSSIECVQGQAKLRREVELTRQTGKTAFVSIDFEPAGFAQVVSSAAFRHERLVLGHRMRKQGAEQPSCFYKPIRSRGRAERP